MRGKCVDEDYGADEGDYEEGQGECENKDSFFPGRHGGRISVFGILVDARNGYAWKEDEEEEHADECQLIWCNNGERVKYIKKKQVHCTPICAIPRRAAAQGNFPISLQQAISVVLSGRVRMLAILAVPDTVPRRTKRGLRPREDRRDMIL